VRVAAAGDERGWNEIVGRFERPLRVVARSHRLNDQDTADAIQTTWLRLLEHIGRLRSPRQLDAWLTTTARREALRISAASRRNVPTGPGELAAELVDDSDPDARLVTDERDRALRVALRRLPARKQVLLRLLATDPQPTYEELSAALDMPIGSIGPSRARALEHLEKEFERQLRAPGRVERPVTPAA
jgi:RNA polymerase sigma factor (sigma-70 family)